MPKFGAGQYGAEISALLQSNSDVIHSSLWGGDLEAFMLQAVPRDLFKKSQLVLVAGEPYLHRLGEQHARRHDRRRARHARRVRAGLAAQHLARRTSTRPRPTGISPNYPAYSTALGFLGLKAAYEKAKIAKLQPSIPMGANKGVKEEMEKAYQVGPERGRDHRGFRTG